MEPYGKGELDVLVVGEAPGETEDQDGRPFVGKAGQFLRDSLRSVGINLDRDAVTTNALICRPPKNKISDPKMIDYCRPNLIHTIEKLRPRVVVTLGRSALVSLLAPYWKSDVGPLERWIGWQIPLERHWVCPTWHPSYLLRIKNELADRHFVDHLEKAFSIKKDPPKQPNFGNKVERLYEEFDILCRIRDVRKAKRWTAFDYEANCLKPEYSDSQIRSCSISNGKHTFAFPWYPGKVAEAVSALLLDPDVPKIASHLKYEDRWTRNKLGHGVSNWGWDTMLAAHCLDNRPGICSLKFQSFVNLGVPSYNERIERYLQNRKGQRYNRIQEIAMEDLLLYNGIDSLLELHLARFQRRKMGYES